MQQPQAENVPVPTQDRLPWRKPTVMRLQVALDTRDNGGSSGDGAFGTPTDLASP
jgi:hypothetical protein